MDCGGSGLSSGPGATSARETVRSCSPAQTAADVKDAIFLLLREREKRGEQWGTVDRETLQIFQTIFEEVGGRGKRFLEVGSGHGFTCVLFGLLGAAEVQGLEVVEEAVRVAQDVKSAVAPDLPVFFRQGDAARRLPYADDSFDVLLLIEVVSHVVTDDLTGFFREIVRVLAPGGLLYIQDGNNARSWFLRRKNYRIWERFEKGPATGLGETIHGHKIGRPYVEARTQIAAAAAPSLSPEVARRIAEGTFCFSEAQVQEAVRHYLETGTLPGSWFQPKICPIEPVSGTYIEQLVDPMEVQTILRSLGYRVVACRPRRHLPANGLWAAFPRATMLVSNGFTMIARKS
jgi:SAM-dependent methyltransferase